MVVSRIARLAALGLGRVMRTYLAVLLVAICCGLWGYEIGKTVARNVVIVMPRPAIRI